MRQRFGAIIMKLLAGLIFVTCWGVQAQTPVGPTAVNGEVDVAIDLLKHAPYADDRVAACQTLAKLGGAKAITALFEALKDKATWPKVAIAAGEALGQIGGTGVEDGLLSIVTKTANKESQAVKAAIAGLGKMKSVRAAKLLITILRNTPQPNSLEEEIINGWVAIGAPAVEPLCEALTRKNDTKVGNAVVNALGQIGDTRANLPIVRYFLANEKMLGSEAAWVAGKALQQIMSKKFMDAYQDPTIIEQMGKIADEATQLLLGPLAGSDEMLRLDTAFVIGKIGYGKCVQQVAAIARGTKNPDLRGACAWVLEIIGSQEAMALSPEFIAGDPATALDHYPELSKTNTAQNTWLLIVALERASDDIASANQFLNSRNAKLKRAAWLWAQSKGYQMSVSY